MYESMPTVNTDPPWIFGHRGAAGLAPENTLPSIERALALGVDGIEIDVQWAHGELWLLHDDTLERTTNGSGSLAANSLATLRSIDAGAGSALPTLPDVLQLMPDDCWLNVELKGPDTGTPTQRLLAEREHGAVLLSSFRWEELYAARASAGSASSLLLGVLCGRLSDRALRTAAELEAWSINLSARWLTKSAVSRVHAAGYRCLVYTVNSLEQARRIRAWGVDGLFTDYPDRITRDALTAPRGSPARPGD